MKEEFPRYGEGRVHAGFAGSFPKVMAKDGTEYQIETTSARWGIHVSKMPSARFSELTKLVDANVIEVPGQPISQFVPYAEISAISTDKNERGQLLFAFYLNIMYGRRRQYDEPRSEMLRLKIGLALGVDLKFKEEPQTA